eukprot:6520767-Ditylum_brightwellii.AAC.1
MQKYHKLKNFTHEIKEDHRKHHSYIKGEVIDGIYKHYTLSIGMMLGICVAVWSYYEGQAAQYMQQKQTEIHNKIEEGTSEEMQGGEDRSNSGNNSHQGGSSSSKTASSTGTDS